LGLPPWKIAAAKRQQKYWKLGAPYRVPIRMAWDKVVPVPRMRYVVVHYHIFKNGGSTVESILEREFSGGFARLHGPEADSTLVDSDLAEFLHGHAEVTAVSSHHLRYPKPAIARTVLFDCCFLRHPLARLHSYYSYLNRIQAADPFSRRARSENVREFLEQLIDAVPHQVSDVQVNLMANGGAFTRPASRQDLKQATEMLRQMALPGVVEMFDESLVAAEYFLRPAFPTIRLEYVAQNVTRSSPSENGDLRAELIGLWGEKLYEKLARLNQMDLELFRRAQTEIQRRLDLVPRRRERLAEFRSRCAELKAAETQTRIALVEGSALTPVLSRSIS